MKTTTTTSSTARSTRSTRSNPAATTASKATTAGRLHNVLDTSRAHFGAHCIPVVSGVTPLATQAPDPRARRNGAYGRRWPLQLSGSGTPHGIADAPVISSSNGQPCPRPQQPPRICTGSSTGHYDGAELAPYTGRPGAMDAMALPSRMENRLHYRSGQVVTMPAAQHPARSVTKA